MAEKAKDYIALIALGGGGSWARDSDELSAINRCVRITHSDWRHLFKLDGERTIVNVFDVSGKKDVYVSDDGCWEEDGSGERRWLAKTKTVEARFPRKRGKGPVSCS